MVGALIDASLRRATLLAEARGFVVPDTKPDLDPTPQIIIEGDDEEIFLDFSDGLGYSTDKKAYRNFGSSFIWVHNGKVQYSASSQSITEDLDGASPGATPVFNENTGKFEAVGLRGAACVEIQAPEDRFYTLVAELPWDIEIIDTFSLIEAGPAFIDFPTGTISAGDPLQFEVTGTSGSSSYLVVQVTFSYNPRATV